MVIGSRQRIATIGDMALSVATLLFTGVLHFLRTDRMSKGDYLVVDYIIHSCRTQREVYVCFFWRTFPASVQFHADLIHPLRDVTVA